MRQAALAGSTRKANFNRLDDARSAVRGHQEWIVFLIEFFSYSSDLTVFELPACRLRWLSPPPCAKGFHRSRLDREVVAAVRLGSCRASSAFPALTPSLKSRLFGPKRSHRT